MKLTADWRQVLRHAWSVRLIALSILLSALELAAPLLQGLLPVRPGIFAALVVLTSIAAGVARVVAQRNLPAGSSAPRSGASANRLGDPDEPDYETGD